MKVLKNILLVIALLFVAMPCTHADGHQHGSPFSSQPDQISAIHSCECHSCDEDAVCTEPLEVAQDLTVSSAITFSPVVTAPLFVLNQYRPAFRQVSSPVPGTLARLTTVQLLI